MPSFVIKTAGGAGATPEAVAAAIAVPELLPRSCKLKPYTKLKSVPAISVEDEIVAYASPDSTFAVTKAFLDGAQKSILDRHLRFLLRPHQAIAAEGDAPGRESQAHARYRQQGRAGAVRRPGEIRRDLRRGAILRQQAGTLLLLLP